MRYIKIQFNVFRIETYSFPTMLNTYGRNHKGLEKHMDILEKNHKFWSTFNLKNKLSLDVYFKHSCIHSTPYVIVIKGKLGASPFYNIGGKGHNKGVFEIDKKKVSC